MRGLFYSSCAGFPFVVRGLSIRRAPAFLFVVRGLDPRIATTAGVHADHRIKSGDDDER
jgi:hypothetical protein